METGELHAIRYGIHCMVTDAVDEHVSSSLLPEDAGVAQNC